MRIGTIAFIKNGNEHDVTDIGIPMFKGETVFENGVYVNDQNDNNRLMDVFGEQANNGPFESSQSKPDNKFPIDSLEVISRPAIKTPQYSTVQLANQQKLKGKHRSYILVAVLCSCNNTVLRHKFYHNEWQSFVDNFEVITKSGKVKIHEACACPHCGDQGMGLYGRFLTHLYKSEDEGRIAATAITIENTIDYKMQPVQSKALGRPTGYSHNEQLNNYNNFRSTVSINELLFAMPFAESLISYTPFSRSYKFIATFSKATQRGYLVLKDHRNKSIVRHIKNGEAFTMNINDPDKKSGAHFDPYDLVSQPFTLLTKEKIIQEGDENEYEYLKDINLSEPIGHLLRQRFYTAFMCSQDPSVIWIQKLIEDATSNGVSISKALTFIANDLARTLPCDVITSSLVPTYARKSRKLALKALFPAYSKKSANFFYSKLQTESSLNRLPRRAVRIFDINYIYLRVIQNPDIFYSTLCEMGGASQKFALDLPYKELFSLGSNKKYSIKGVSRLLKRLLSHFDDPDRAVFNALTKLDDHFLKDILESLTYLSDHHLLNSFMKDACVKNLKQFHDVASSYISSLKNGNEKVHYPAELLSKLKFETESHDFYAVQTTAELRVVGAQMHHCVGTYDYKLKFGSVLILVGKNKDTGRYDVCIEVGTHGLNQVKLQRNQRLSLHENHRQLLISTALYLKQIPVVPDSVITDLTSVHDYFVANLDMAKLFDVKSYNKEEDVFFQHTSEFVVPQVPTQKQLLNA